MKKLPTKVDVLGIPVSPTGVGDVRELFANKGDDRHLIATFVNPLACALDRQHSDYVGLLNKFDIVACDGIGMVKAAHTCGAEGLERESFDFTSLADAVLQTVADSGLRLGLVGGEPGVTQKATEVLIPKYPGLQVTACYSGFGQEPQEALEHFTENELDVVICAMGAPLQERFLLDLVAKGWRGTGFTCGGFLDQLIVGEAYYPDWVDRLNIRFLYRLLKEPRRLWRRYLVDYQVFLGRYGKLQWNRLKSKIGIGKQGV